MKRGLWLFLLTTGLASSLLGTALLWSSLVTPPQAPVAEKGPPPRWHFALLVTSLDEPSTVALRQGCEEAATAADAVLETFGAQFHDPVGQADWLEVAIWAKVDGLIVQVPDAVLFGPLINRALKNGIPVVTLDRDTDSQGKTTFLSGSQAEIGSALAGLAAEGRPAPVKVALLSQSFQDPLLKTLTDDPRLRVTPILDANLGVFGAEEACRSVLFDHPEIEVIVCGTPGATLGAAQTLVDFNKVGRIRLVGVGDQPEILSYVQKGVLVATVAVDNIAQGRSAVLQLTQRLAGGPGSPVEPAPIRVVRAP